jgi:hypothetical protein
VFPALEKAANFVRDRRQDGDHHGFGPPDYSIWEERLAYNTFTQTAYVAGLRAAELLAETFDQPRDWGDAAEGIRSAIFRSVDGSSCPGLWNADGRYFIRSVYPDCTANRIVDSSSDLLWVLGVLRVEDPKVGPHRDAVLANLTPTHWGYGISRYEGDTFYASAPFSPGGKGEAQADEPSWPQMAMYMAMLEHWLGNDELAGSRLSWYVSTTLRGGMPQGEAVDWSTQRCAAGAAGRTSGHAVPLRVGCLADAFEGRHDPAAAPAGTGTTGHPAGASPGGPDAAGARPGDAPHLTAPTVKPAMKRSRNRL